MDEGVVYDDLPEFDLGGNIKQIEHENVQLKERILSLEKELAEMSKNIEAMKTTQANLEKNMSELFKTAKAEINRKDRLISDLRSQVEQILFNRRENKRKRDNNDNFHLLQAEPVANKKAKTEEQPSEKSSAKEHKHRSHSRDYDRSRSRDKSRSRHEKHNRSKSRDSRHYYSSSDSNNGKKSKENEKIREKHRSRSKESESKGKIQILDNILISKGKVDSVAKIEKVSSSSRQPLQKVPAESSKHSSSFVGEPKQEELFKPDVKVKENRNTSVQKKPKSNIEEVSKILLEKQSRKSTDESADKNTSNSKTASSSSNSRKDHRRKSGDNETISNHKTDVEKSDKTVPLKIEKKTIEEKREPEISKEAIMEERARQFLVKDTIDLNPPPIVNKSKEIKHREEKSTVEVTIKKTDEKAAKINEKSSQSNNNQKEIVSTEANKTNQPISSPKKQKPKAAKPNLSEESKSDNSQEQKAILPENQAAENKKSEETVAENTLPANDATIKDLPAEPVKVDSQKVPKKARIRNPKEKPEEVIKPANLPENKISEQVVQVINISPQKVTKHSEILNVEHVTAESELSEVSNANSPEKQKKKIRRLNIKGIVENSVEETKSINSQPEKIAENKKIDVKPSENDLNIVTKSGDVDVPQKSPKKTTVEVGKAKVEKEAAKPVEEKKIVPPEKAEVLNKVQTTENGTIGQPSKPKVRRSKFKVNVNQAKEMREKLKNEAINKLFLEKLIAASDQQQPIHAKPKTPVIHHPPPAEEKAQILVQAPAVSEKIETIEEQPLILKELRVSLIQVETPPNEMKETENVQLNDLEVKQTEAESRRKYYKRTRSPRKAINVVEDETMDIVSQIEANLIADSSPPLEPAPKRKYQRKTEPKLIEQDSKLELEIKPKRKVRKRNEYFLDINNIVDGQVAEDNPDKSPTKENRVLRSSVKKPAPLIVEEKADTAIVQKLKIKFSPISETDDKSDSIHFSLNSSITTEAAFNLSHDDNFTETQTLLSSTPISKSNNENSVSVLIEDLNTSSVGQEEKNSSSSIAKKKSKKSKLRKVTWKIVD